jgi:anti-sigma factor RsiW
MSRDSANALWGSEAVEFALKEPAPEEVTPELLAQIRKHLDPPGVFRSWALAQPWPRFCAIVRVVSGAMLDEVLKHGDQ